MVHGRVYSVSAERAEGSVLAWHTVGRLRQVLMFG